MIQCKTVKSVYKYSKDLPNYIIQDSVNSDYILKSLKEKSYCYYAQLIWIFKGLKIEIWSG